jgi:hypothetical protein
MAWESQTLDPPTLRAQLRRVSPCGSSMLGMDTGATSLPRSPGRITDVRSLNLAGAAMAALRPGLLLVMLQGVLLITGCNRSHDADVVATVNGHAIMRADLDKMYTAQLGEAQGQQPSPEQADTLRLNIVRELIDEEIVQQRAAKMNLTATAEDVDARLAEMKAPYTEEQFAERLKASNHTLDDVKHDLRRSLTIDKLLNKEINSKVTVSDADIAKYYNQHKDEYNLIETRKPARQQGDHRRRGEEKDPSAQEPARCGRGLRRPGDELLREPRDRLEWRRHGLPLRIGNARRRPRDLRRRGQAKGG